MSKPTRKQIVEKLRAARVFNTHGLVKLAQGSGERRVGVFVRYRMQETGRAFQSAAYQVVRIGHKTDPGGYWRDYGHKTFLVTSPVRQNRPKARAEAIAWASERYSFDPDGWVVSPFGHDWLPRTLLDGALSALEQGWSLSQRNDEPIRGV